MDKLTIEGPNTLKGEITVSGAKNSALPILAATILAKGSYMIDNVPEVTDVYTMLKILKALGAKLQFSKNQVCLDTTGLSRNRADYRYVSTMRASVCLLGPLLARFGKAYVSMPGGCVIGPRPIDLHLKGLRALGARIELDHGYIVADTKKKLKSTQVYLGGAYGSSVLATANVMMVAVLTPGNTVIENAACEPEIVDLGSFLIKMGAKVHGLSSPRIEIQGVKELNACDHSIISDRIEAGSYMIAASMAKGDVNLRHISLGLVGAVFDKLSEAGVEIKTKKNEIRVRRRRALKPLSVTTLAYPGFPTDLQAQMMALMSLTPGISVITEKIFPERFMHVGELNRMGANIRLEGNNAIVDGARFLSGAPVMASDLRASAALVVAGLVARGKTEISRVYHLDRGYEHLVEKLQTLGAKVKREK
jgi:UDP-N-acetylglucosamine 1-carboxyvinyltransferase